MQALEESLAQTRAELQALKSGATAAESAGAAGGSAEAVAADPAQDAASVSTEAVAASESPAAASKNAFNPAISIVLNGIASSHTLDPELYQRSGFPLIGEGAPSARGISLGSAGA